MDHDEKCLDLHDNSTAFHANCSDDARICQVKRISLTTLTKTGDTTGKPKLWILKRDCIGTCDPGCIIIGERTKLYSCTTCCEQSYCNYGNNASQIMHLALVDISNNKDLIRIGRKLETSRAMIDDYVPPPPPRRKGNFLLEPDLTCLDALNPTTTRGSLKSSGSTRWKSSYASKLDASSPNLVVTSNTETRALPSTLSTYVGTC
ncbi:hypothetical protein FQA39_LY18096 [Lamprigera yunnana]|nr:hypothetical protein FQA39_LY18096 [Lamprigera yunnana]